MDAIMSLRYAYHSVTSKLQRDPIEVELFLDVMYREEDDLEAFNQLPDYLERYNVSQCLKYTGITFTEWLDLPIPIGETILEVCGDLRSEENRIQAEAMEEKRNESRLY